MLQTGRYATHSGVVCNFVETNPEQPTLAKVFSEAGYDTGFIGKWHLSAGKHKMAGKHVMTRPDQQRAADGRRKYAEMNPETEFVPPGPQRLGYDHWQTYNFHSSFNNYWYYEDDPEKIFSGKFEIDTQIDQAIDYMNRHQQSGTDRPFMLVVAPHPPHPPFGEKDCPAGYREKIRTDIQWSPNVPESHRLGRTYEDARSYYSMCQNMDDNLGRIMKYLDDNGLAEETILVFTSDHGEMLGSQDRRNKMVPYAEAVNVPLIYRWPGRIRAGTQTDLLQSPIDFFPTLCGLTGLSAPGTCDGYNLSPLLFGRERMTRDAIFMANYTSNWDYFDSGTNWPEWRGVRTDRFTYAKWLDGREMLFDNQADPYQMWNLAEGYQDLPTLLRMRSRLKDFLSEAHDDFLPGTAYAEWYDDERNLVRTGLGKV
jgi:arylsulfatase A-like enzyme